MMASPEISLAISATSFGMIVGFLAGYAVRAYISYSRRRARPETAHSRNRRARAAILGRCRSERPAPRDPGAAAVTALSSTSPFSRARNARGKVTGCGLTGRLGAPPTYTYRRQRSSSDGPSSSSPLGLGRRAPTRWVVTTAAVFGAIESYAQWFERLGAEPWAIIGAGLTPSPSLCGATISQAVAPLRSLLEPNSHTQPGVGGTPKERTSGILPRWRNPLARTLQTRSLRAEG